MSKYKFDATIIFMAAGRRAGPHRSHPFAEQASEEGLNIAGMITNDIIGNTSVVTA
jgi:hypothetical protein